MKVLWFSLSPCGSIRKDNKQQINQGWLISLEDEIKNYAGIELYVAFYSSVNIQPFEYDGVKYYPIQRPMQGNVLRNRIFPFIPQSFIDKKSIFLFLRVIEQVKPDIIHIHGTEEAFGMICKLTEIPVVISIQGLLSPISYKFFSGLPRDIIAKYENLWDRVRNMSYLRDFEVNKYRRARELTILKDAKYIMGRTFWDRNITGVINPSRQYFVVNEILRNPFYHNQWFPHKSNKLSIVSTVSIGIYKGYETLLTAANILLNYSRIEFEWKLIGYSQTHKCAKISHHMTGLNPDNCNIVFLGVKNANEMVDILKTSDIYCHVSHIENSPNSVCEAMILGMPVISTFAGGTASMLENGKEGILIQDGDPFILAGAILDMWNNYSLAIEYGKNARERALKRHSPETVGKEVLNAYNKILQNG